MTFKKTEHDHFVTFPLLLPAVVLSAVLLLSGCIETESDTPDSDISATGVSLFLEANIPLGDTLVQVAAAAYEDGSPAPLTGGDVLVARTESEEKALLDFEQRDNYYKNTLTMNNPDTEVELEVAFDPQGTRSDRWYPTEELLVDPGPGSIVGFQASMTFPESIDITGPVANTAYSSRSDELALQWLGSASDELVLISYNTCFFETSSDQISWVDSRNITDDQSHTLTVGDLIPEDGVVETINTTGNLLAAFIQLSFSLFFEAFTFGLYEPEEIVIPSSALEYCTLSISLVRQKEGTLGEGVSGGRVVGSRSDKVVVEYRP